MCVCVYVCMCTFVRVHMFICKCAFVHAHRCICRHIYIRVYVYLCICLHACVFAYSRIVCFRYHYYHSHSHSRVLRFSDCSLSLSLLVPPPLPELILPVSIVRLLATALRRLTLLVSRPFAMKRRHLAKHRFQPASLALACGQAPPPPDVRWCKFWGGCWCRCW